MLPVSYVSYVPVCHVGSAQVLGGKVQPEILQGAVALSTKLVHIYAWVAVAAFQYLI